MYDLYNCYDYLLYIAFMKAYYINIHNLAYMTRLAGRSVNQ